MAEIPVEKKSGKGWLWALLVLLVLALLAWWLLDNDGNDVVEYTENETATEVVGAQAGTDPAASPEPVASEEGFSIANILANPDEYVGRDDFQGEVAVPEVPTDRGFWVENQGERLFALIIDNPREQPVDINAGQQLRVTEGRIRDASALSQLPGAPLDADTRRILDEQTVFLLVDEENIEILSRS